MSMLNNKRERSEKEEDASSYKKKLLDMLNNELKSDESMMNDYVDITSEDNENYQIYLKVIKRKFDVNELSIIGFVDLSVIDNVINSPLKAYMFYKNIDVYFEMFSMNTNDENDIINKTREEHKVGITKIKKLPNTKGKTLVADVSSCFLSEPVDVEKYGVIYGGVQKNVGPAGVVIVIAREDLITDDVLPGTPTMLKWKTQADNDSLYNTPPCYGIYICGKVFKWLKKMGGLEEMKKRNIEKAEILYNYLDESKMFKGTVRKEDRSLMNVPFVTGDKDLDAKFVKEATEAGFVNLKGHRTVGGMRASIYNAMPKEGVEKLVEFMKKFEKENA